MNAKNMQSLSIILFLIGLWPVATHNRDFAGFSLVVLSIATVVFLIGLAMNGWKLYNPDEQRVDERDERIQS